MTSGNGKAATPTVYGTPAQMAQLLASVAQLVEIEPDSTFEDSAARLAARGLAGLLHERLGATIEGGLEAPGGERPER